MLGNWKLEWVFKGKVMEKGSFIFGWCELMSGTLQFDDLHLRILFTMPFMKPFVAPTLNEQLHDIGACVNVHILFH